MNSPGVKVQVIEPTETKGVCLVERRSVYGNILYYPSNETARIFAELVNKIDDQLFDLGISEVNLLDQSY